MHVCHAIVMNSLTYTSPLQKLMFNRDTSTDKIAFITILAYFFTIEEKRISRREH